MNVPGEGDRGRVKVDVRVKGEVPTLSLQDTQVPSLSSSLHEAPAPCVLSLSPPGSYVANLTLPG